MSGFFLILMVFIALTILPAMLRANNKDNSRIVNADWMTNSEKFHMISRWGA